jgi:hypothetical protein
VRVRSAQIQRLAESALASKGVAIGSAAAEGAARSRDLDAHASKIEELKLRAPLPKGGPLLVKPAPRVAGALQASSVESVSGDLHGFLEAVSEAVAEGWSRWQSAAKLTGVMIDGPVGNLAPGGLQGAGFEKSLLMMRIRSKAAALENVKKARAAPAKDAKMPGSQIADGRAIAKAREDSPDRGSKPAELDFFLWHAEAIIGACCDSFAAWQRGYSAQLSFPAGAACAATLPPVPNVPAPLGSGRSPGEAALNPRALASRMMADYGARRKHPALTKAVFESFADAFSKSFATWKSATLITQVIGVGGIAPSPPLPPGPVSGAAGNGGSLV